MQLQNNTRQNVLVEVLEYAANTGDGNIKLESDCLANCFAINKQPESAGGQPRLLVPTRPYKTIDRSAAWKET